MIQQLDIFSLPTQSSSELPKAVIPIDPKVEAAINSLLELKELALSQFQIGSRIITGDLHGAIASIENELAQVLFDGESKARSVFLDSLELESKPITEGCIVKSDLFFKNKTAKVINLYQIGAVAMATVELELQNSLVKFPCGISALEVVA
ncbi:MAG: hypothetical protein ACK5Z3_23580 [Pseudanabaena sp.]